MAFVIQSAEFESVAAARRAETRVAELIAAYVEFERSDADPWRSDRVPPPLARFGRAHGVEWPLAESSRFLLKGEFDDAAELLRVDRLLFFWGVGFELGGPTLRAVLRAWGATRTSATPHVGVRCAGADARAEELADFLAENGCEASSFGLALPQAHEFALSLDDGASKRTLRDDQGWSFVEALPQLDGEDPRLLPRDPRASS